jgi:transposase
MAQWSKPLSLRKLLAEIQRIGGKKGSKRHILVDGRGVPLSIVVTGANRHDVSQLEVVLDEIMIYRPDDIVQHLCADKGYSGKPAQKIIKERDYVPYIKQRGEEIQEKKNDPKFKARRWVVEAAHSWFNRFRKLRRMQSGLLW